MLRLLQIWILPDKNGYEPNYGEFRFSLSDRNDKWLPIATSAENRNSIAPIRIHADINAYATIISKGNHLDFKVNPSRQAHLVLVEGKAEINEITLSMRDALEITEQDIDIKAIDEAHIVVIEMAKN